MTEDVVAHVLYDSFLQAQIIAQEVDRSPARMFSYEDLVALLEETGLLDRASEDLPTGDELTERRRGRARARAARAGDPARVLEALGGAVAGGAAGSPTTRWFERDLRSYFPGAVVERCGDLLGEHPLRTQLICMINANSVVNALGPTFVSSLVAERGADVVRGRARLPDRRRGHGRRRAVGGDRGLVGHRPGGADGAARRDRRAWWTRPPAGT